MPRTAATRNPLRRMTLRTRILLGLTGLTVLLALPAVYAANRLAELRSIAFELRSQHAVAFLALGQTRTALAEYERFVRSYVAAVDASFREEAEQALKGARRQAKRLADAGYAREAAEVGYWLEVQDAQLQQIATLVEAGRVEEATDALDRIEPALQSAGVLLNDVASAIDRRTVENVLAARNISDAAAAGVVLAATACFALALLLGAWGARRLTAPILRLRRAMAAVARGRFVAPAGLPYHRQDEIGGLSRSFRAMTRRLQQLERLRAEYSSVVTHDLRTPLNVIAGYAQLLDEGIYQRMTPEQRTAVAAIREQTVALTALADQLLEMSRFEAGRIRIHPRMTPLRDVLDPIHRAFSGLAADHGIEFLVELDPDCPSRLCIDAERLRVQVLSNLLSNALKFTPAGGRVTLRVWREDDSLFIAVADTGVGIPDDQLPHIFDKFYRVMGDDRPAGAGLGLAIAREVVAAHGGTITASSAPNAGTTMLVMLPIDGRAARRTRRRAA